jgi:gliding motility-associated-like protein
LVYSLDDLTADVHSASYYYRFVAITKCGDEVSSANVSRSIWLQCTSQDAQNEIQYNSYETWMHGVENYTLFRSINGEPPAGEILTSTSLATPYTDPLTGVDPRKLVCYWVEANENLTTAFSKSNTCCVLKEPAIFMPNAFHPGSAANNVFRPVNDTAFADPRSFSLTIFNRWGQQLCETTDMIQGWDGTSNGQDSPTGIYTYLLTYKSKEGKSYTKRGTVLLVR